MAGAWYLLDRKPALIKHSDTAFPADEEPKGASLLAKPHFQSPENVADCPGLFLSKLSPTWALLAV
jgi:hypothetical protein